MDVHGIGLRVQGLDFIVQGLGLRASRFHG